MLGKGWLKWTAFPTVTGLCWLLGSKQGSQVRQWALAPKRGEWEVAPRGQKFFETQHSGRPEGFGGVPCFCRHGKGQTGPRPELDYFTRVLRFGEGCPQGCLLGLPFLFSEEEAGPETCTLRRSHSGGARAQSCGHFVSIQGPAGFCPPTPSLPAPPGPCGAPQGRQCAWPLKSQRPVPKPPAQSVVQGSVSL